jgi:8-hydroxy-5-deazaflavin:NADPH oxidoreductase
MSTQTPNRIAVLGSGTVGRTLADRLTELGHEVHVGTRSDGTYAEAAAQGELVVNATPGTASLEALEAAGAENLSGKVLLDVANPLVREEGGVALEDAPDSLAERIQRAFPDARVVKALNTVNAALMVRPELVPGDHVLFMAGDDDAAKRTVVALLGELGWPGARVLDLGGLPAARAMEAYLPLWVQLMGTIGHPRFNVALQIGSQDGARGPGRSR